MKKRMKVLIILGVVVVSSLGVYGLSSFIVDKSYDSYLEVSKEKSDKEKKQKKVEITDAEEPNEVSDQQSEVETREKQEYTYEDYSKYEGVEYKPGDTINDEGVRVYIERLRNVVFASNSPFYQYMNTCTIQEEDLASGAKKFTLKTESGDIFLMVYGNSVDYAPYIFAKTTAFTPEEEKYIKSLGNGVSGFNNETGEYYWEFM